MSDDFDDSGPGPVFRNPETIQRRAWIDRALAGVRERLAPEAADTREPSTKRPDSAAESAPPGPRLYIVRGNRP